MAPDINSLSASRRPSKVMGPPPVPSSTTVNGHHIHRGPASPMATASEPVGGPLRHPRPLTAAELHAECEKEQEAVVNRLTRELTALRAQSASVASNASRSSTSTSASFLPVDINDSNPTHQMTGATHPTPSRRHRSSSSVSARSMNTPSLTSASAAGSGITNLSTPVHTGSNTTVPVGGVSQASADRAAAAGGSLSRQPSVSASGTSTPARQSLDIARGSNYTLPHRPSLSRDPSYASTQNTSSTVAQAGTPSPYPHPLPSPAQSPSASVYSAMQHYADTAAYRTEMEIVKAENDMLRQRVRTLERALRARRRDSSQSDAARPDLLSNRVSIARESMAGSIVTPAAVASWDGGVGGVAGPRERSESQSTTASSVARRQTGALGADDEVRVGESALSAGLGRGA